MDGPRVIAADYVYIIIWLCKYNMLFFGVRGERLLDRRQYSVQPPIKSTFLYIKTKDTLCRLRAEETTKEWWIAYQ